jgi:4-hydroxybenzoate polyprenyltransferase
MLKYLRSRKNIPYIIMLMIGIGIATYKYDFISAIIGFGVVIIFSLIMGYLINKLIK